MNDQTTNTEAQPDCAAVPGSVIGEYVRLDKIIRDCENSILMADRLIKRGCWQAKWNAELDELRAKLAKTLSERDWLDSALTRAALSQNKEISNS